MNHTKAFALSIIVVIVIFVISAFSAGIIAGYFGVWKKPFIGGAAAFFVVISGYLTAPTRKRLAASIWLVVGAIAAWILAGESYYPEDHQHAYQLTIIPLAATYLSGIFALLLCILWHKNRNN